MNATEKARSLARQDRVLTRERAVRERLAAWFERAGRAEEQLTGSSLGIVADALRGDPLPAADPERLAWFTAQISASIDPPADPFTSKRLARLVSALAAGLSLAGDFATWGDLAARCAELIADFFPQHSPAVPLEKHR